MARLASVQLSVQKKKNPTNKKTKQNCCLQGEARGRQKLEMQEPGEVSTLGMCMYVGRKKKETGKGESFRKNEIEKESG